MSRPFDVEHALFVSGRCQQASEATLGGGQREDDPRELSTQRFFPEPGTQGSVASVNWEGELLPRLRLRLLLPRAARLC